MSTSSPPVVTEPLHEVFPRIPEADKEQTEEIRLEGIPVPQTTSSDLENGLPTSPNLPGSRNNPRADGGRDAWLFLAGCFVFEAMIWGFPFSFGVFQSYYSTHMPFSYDHNSISAIGTCSTGVMYLFAPISLYVVEAWPCLRRLSSVVGLTVATSALIASSFSTKVWHLILTQGVMYAIGGSLLYSPTLFYLDEWFVKKKGLAFGVMWAGVGASGLVFPFVLTVLLNKYGFVTTLRVWSLILFFSCAPLILFIKPRLRLTTPATRHKPSYAFLLKPTFLLLQASNILESLGFFLPAIYLQSYGTTLQLGPNIGTLLIALLNLFSVIGAVVLGHLCDKMHVSHVIAISTFGTTLSVFVFWGFAREASRLIIFAMVYGFFAGGYSALWAGMMKEVQEVKGCESVGMGVLMGVFAAGRGIGAVTSGPVSEVLLGWKIGGNAGYGGEYGAVVIFTGLSALAGGVGWVVRRSMRGQVQGLIDESIEGSVAGSSLKKRNEAVAFQAEVHAETAHPHHRDHVKAEAEALTYAHSKAPTDADASSQRSQTGGRVQARSSVTK